MLNLAIMAGGWAISAWAATQSAKMTKSVVNAAMDTTQLKRTQVSWGGHAVVITQSDDWYLYTEAEKSAEIVVRRAFKDLSKEDQSAVTALLKKASVGWCLGNDIGVGLMDDLEISAIQDLKVALCKAHPGLRTKLFRFAQRVVELAKE